MPLSCVCNCYSGPVTLHCTLDQPCRPTNSAATAAGGAAQPGKRKLLSVSSTFRMPGDAVPAHVAFGAAKVPRLGTTSSGGSQRSAGRHL